MAAIDFSKFFGRSGGNNNSAQQNSDANAGQNNDNKHGDGNNNNSEGTKKSFDPATNIWNQPKPENNNNGGGDNTNKQQQNNNGNNNGSGQNDNAVLDAYLNGLGLDVNVDSAAIEKFRNDGDFSAIQKSINDSIKKVFVQGLTDSNKLVQAAVDRAVDKALTTMRQETNANSVISRMNEKLPFTKDGNVAPIAQAVLNQFIKTHKGDVDKAIDSVREFFQHTNKLSAKDLGLNVTNEGGPGSRRFVNNQNSGDTDWVKFLTADG